MTETSTHRLKPAVRLAANKGQSEFYRQVILPSRTYKDRHQLPAKQVKEAALTYHRQPPLGNALLEKHRSSLQRQLSTDMLRQGCHQSFRELSSILAWQKKDRQRLGSEHPLHRQPLLEDEPDKLRFLCLYLTKAEEAERRRQYASMYKSYSELAMFFVKSEDYWLSDFFHKKCLSMGKTYSQLDSELAAQAFLNMGLSYERQGNLQQALQHFEQYRLAGDNYHDLRIHANLQLVRIYLKLAERGATNETLGYTSKAYEASLRSDDKKTENETCYKLGLVHLAQNDLDSALQYLHKYYDYCQQVADDKGLGQASEAIAICYQKKSDPARSTEYLTKYLQKVSTKPADHQYTTACSALGLIDTTLGRYDSAIKSCSKAYSISLANKYPDLDRNRVLYGVARGLKLREILNERVDQMNTESLLQWKRTPLENTLTDLKR